MIYSFNLLKWFNRYLYSILLGGEITLHLFTKKIYIRNLSHEMKTVGPNSLSICLLTACFVSMVFTLQVTKQFINFSATSALGGVISLALVRELSPVLTSVIVTGKIGSAFTAEISTMKVTEQIDALYLLKTDPIDYLAVPKVIACFCIVPILNILSLFTGISSSLMIVAVLYNISSYIFLNSAQVTITLWDIICSSIKSAIFGAVIAIISCGWGLTTVGGSKAVGETTTTAVVTILLSIFILDFILSYVMFANVDVSLNQGI